MNIAVTGASGFVGSHIARTFAAHGHTVHSFGLRREDALREPIPNYARWDIAAGIIEAPPVDVVVHCAALVGDWGRESDYRRVNVDGTANVLAAFPIARVIAISTSSVYSDAQPRPLISESAPAGDCHYSAYARTKAAAEQLILARRNTVVLRPHIVYGPGDTTLLPRLVASRRFGVLFVPGDGENRLSITHVDNLVAATVAAAATHTQAVGTFNIADAGSTTLRVLLQTVFSRLNLPTRLAFIPGPVAWSAATVLEALWPTKTPPRGPLLTRYLVHQLTSTHVLDTRRAQSQLGYAPLVDLETGAL